MPKTNSTDLTRFLRRLAGVSAFVFASCHPAAPPATAGTTSSQSAANASAKTSARAALTPVVRANHHTFGDTLAHPVRILAFDRISELASVMIKAPKNMVVLAVVPGRDIEVIYPGDMTMQKTSNDVFLVSMGRFMLATSTVAATNGNARQAYENCKRQRAAMIAEAARAERGRRDSTGRIVKSADPAMQREPPTCDMEPDQPRVKLTRVPMPVRDDAERYLVVLSASSTITATDLNERLTKLTTVASDPALTIEAIAAGIFAGQADTFAGAWIPWE